MIVSLGVSLGVVAGLVLAFAAGLGPGSPWTIFVVVLTANAGFFGATRLASASRLASKQKSTEGARQQGMIELVERTLPHMRLGLTPETAGRTAKLLHDAMRLDAVGITDEQQLLAFVGNGSDHHGSGDRIESRAARQCLETNETVVSEFAAGTECRSEDRCPLTAVIAAPLTCRSEVVGSLLVYQIEDASPSPGLVALTRGLAGMLSLQLEVALTGREAQMAETAKLDALRAQINPHFLFNTLNTIAMKARTDPEETRRLLVRLSDFLRYAMKHTGHLAPFSEEYFFVRTYLFLEKARFGDRLKVRYDVDPQCLSIPVPVLTIQPLIENAVKHGIGLKPDGGLVELKARLEPMGGILRIRVGDDGVGMDGSKLSTVLNADGGEMSALANINERLVRIYKGRASLDLRSAPEHGTTVSLSLPVGVD